MEWCVVNSLYVWLWTCAHTRRLCVYTFTSAMCVGVYIRVHVHAHTHDVPGVVSVCV